jgi:hypothetical protein
VTLIDLKKSIHEKIDNLDDPDYLDMSNTMLYNKDEVFVIPERMKEGIKQGTEDIKNGDIYTMANFENKYRGWLKVI